jgi:hypothetical protein
MRGYVVGVAAGAVGEALVEVGAGVGVVRAREIR